MQVLVGSVLLVATNILALSIPRKTGEAIDLLRNADLLDTTEPVLRIVAVIAALAVGAGTTRILSRIAVFNVGRHIEYDIRNQLFKHLCRLEPAWFQRQATGDLVSRIINDVNNVRLLYGLGTLHIVNTTVAYTFVLSRMLSVSPRLTLLSLAPYPLVLIVMRFFTRAIYLRTQDAQAQLSQLSALSQENLSGAAVVRAFGIQPQARSRFRTASDEYVHQNMRLAIVRGGLFPFMGSISGLGALIVLWFGGRAVISGEISLGHFAEFSSYIAVLAWPTIAMGWVLSVWQRGAASFDRLMIVLGTDPAIENAADGGLNPRAGEVSPTITFDSVSLTYDDGTEALHDIDLEIEGGRSVAVVGRTGAGKSTLIQLIARLRDPTTGELRIDDVPLRDVALDSVRASIAVVPQDPFLFSRSVRDNITFGVLDDHDAAGSSSLRIDDAIRIAGLTEALEALPDGLDTVVGERGITLSGGQKQRVTIARAVLLDARILILDDALSSVDTGTERRILSELQGLMKGRTTILVTHRFNALDLFDEVIVMDEGRVVERGSHRSLIEAGGAYAEMVERQRLEEGLS